MKRLLLAAAFAAAAAPLAAQSTSTVQSALIEKIVSTKNARQVYVVPLGQYYHRYDHLVVDGALELTPEAALERQYSRCPECLPPADSKELNDEIAQAEPRVSKYYRKYLAERVAPTSDQVPPGVLPRSEPVRVPTPGVPRP